MLGLIDTFIVEPCQSEYGVLFQNITNVVFPGPARHRGAASLQNVSI